MLRGNFYSLEFFCEEINLSLRCFSLGLRRVWTVIELNKPLKPKPRAFEAIKVLIHTMTAFERKTTLFVVEQNLRNSSLSYFPGI